MNPELLLPRKTFFLLYHPKDIIQKSHGQQIPRFPLQQAHQAEQLAQANENANRLSVAYSRLKYDLEDANNENESNKEFIASLEFKLEKSDKQAVKDLPKIFNMHCR